MVKRLVGAVMLAGALGAIVWLTFAPRMNQISPEAERAACAESDPCFTGDIASRDAPVAEGGVAPEDAGVPPRSGDACPSCGDRRTIWVDQANGDDRNTGLSIDDALKTIGQGALLLRGGDIMMVRPGVYYETPVFSDLGSSEGSPVWIRSEKPGEAVISGLWPAADQGRVAWTPLGDGLYAAAHGDSFMGEAAGRFLFRYKSLADLEAGAVIGISKPPYGFAHQDGQIYLRLPDGVDPNGLSVKLTDRFSQPIVTIKTSPYVILDGFRIAGAGGTDAIETDQASHHLTLRNLVVTHSRRAARLPDDSLFEWSEYTYPGFYRFVDDLIDLNDGDNQAIFELVKTYFSEDGNAWLEGGIAESFATPSRNVEFRYLYTHQIFDGQRLGAFVDSSSHHNVCEYAYDDCIEFEHWRPNHPGSNLRVHDSLLLNAMGSALSHQDSSGTMRGPQFVYRNVIYNTDFKHAHPTYLVKNKNLRASTKIVYHHNLLQNWKGANDGWGQTNWLYWDNKAGDPQYLTFRNNIILFDDLSDDGYPDHPDSDSNILVNARDNPQLRGAAGRYLGVDAAALRFRNPDDLDFTLEEGSPAIDAGVALPSDWPDSRTVSGQPDIGPFEFGDTIGPDWPRPRRTVFTKAEPDRWR